MLRYAKRGAESDACQPRRAGVVQDVGFGHSEAFDIE